jgi:hypothetical protein
MVATWTSVAPLATARQWTSGIGNTTAALAVGGEGTPAPTSTEEWTGAGALVTKTITVS